MLKQNQKLAIYMEQALGGANGKMGHGVMRYIPNPIACVIDSSHAGKRVHEACALPFDFPVVASIEEAVALGAEVLVLGIAPSGGRIPEDWVPALVHAIENNMSIVNGLHDQLNPRFGELLRGDQWLWDIRQPSFVPAIGSAQAASLNNTRVLFVGTDMTIGKMTAGLELYRWLIDKEHSTHFVATGQIGITITGDGIPLDSFKVDHACGAVETKVMQAQGHDYILVEGQGSILHPGSTATLPLMRGACPNRLIMCHRAGMKFTRANTKVPPLPNFIQLNEMLAACCGSLTKATTVGIALNTMDLNDHDAHEEVSRLENETGLPVTDVVRFGPDKLGEALIHSS